MEKYKLSDLFDKIDISNEILTNLALETGFIKRNRSVTATHVLFALCSESINGTVSYNDIASQIECKTGVSVSKQAIHKKVTDPCLAFFQGVLEQVILNKLNKRHVGAIRAACQYKRILIQDSTIIKLPDRLFKDYSGVANQSTQICNARIQGVYDIINERFVSFSIDPYSKNDLKSAPELELKQGDLTLRDRGYLIYDEMQRHIDNGAHCLYRYKFGMILLDPITEEPIDIVKEVRKRKVLDIKVKLNNKERTLVRITAMPIDEKTANTRRMKVKQEKKLHPPRNICSCYHGQSLLRQYRKSRLTISCCSDYIV